MDTAFQCLDGNGGMRMRRREHVHDLGLLRVEQVAGRAIDALNRKAVGKVVGLHQRNVGKPDEIKGEAIAAFVTVEQGRAVDEALRKELMQWVVKEIGALARPDEIRFTDALPKTRSGKIMRRLLRDIAAGRESVGDTTTLEDYSVLAALRQEEE